VIGPTYPCRGSLLAAAIERYFRAGLRDPFRAASAETRYRLSWGGLIHIIEELSRELADRVAARRC
jgi:hypothetical protein